jgi:hypothetical protein
MSECITITEQIIQLQIGIGIIQNSGFIAVAS